MRFLQGFMSGHVLRVPVTLQYGSGEPHWDESVDSCNDDKIRVVYQTVQESMEYCASLLCRYTYLQASVHRNTA